MAAILLEAMEKWELHRLVLLLVRRLVGSALAGPKLWVRALFFAFLPSRHRGRWPNQSQTSSEKSHPGMTAISSAFLLASRRGRIVAWCQKISIRF